MTDNQRVDALVDIVDVAVSVLHDYAGDGEDTRIARMARWICCNLGMVINDHLADGTMCLCAEDEEFLATLHMTEHLAINVWKPLSPLYARHLAVVLYRCIERLEQR